MIVRFNPSGTHIHKGFLKIRLDVYPEPGDKTYAMHYVDHLDREPTEDELADPVKYSLIPKHKEVNPCLCHFVIVDPAISLSKVTDLVKGMFDAGTISSLDDALSSNDLNKVEHIMRPKSGRSRTLDSGEIDTAIAAINTRLKDVSIRIK